MSSNDEPALQRLSDAAANMRRAIADFQLEVSKLSKLANDIEHLSDNIQRRGKSLTVIDEQGRQEDTVVKLPRILEGGPTYRGENSKDKP